MANKSRLGRLLNLALRVGAIFALVSLISTPDRSQSEVSGISDGDQQLNIKNFDRIVVCSDIEDVDANSFDLVVRKNFKNINLKIVDGPVSIMGNDGRQLFIYVGGAKLSNRALDCMKNFYISDEGEGAEDVVRSAQNLIGKLPPGLADTKLGNAIQGAKVVLRSTHGSDWQFVAIASDEISDVRVKSLICMSLGISADSCRSE